jgi:putative SOS response-associated peptidase YedK
MCANYAPSRADLLEALTSLRADFGISPEVYPGQVAPIIRISSDGEVLLQPSVFGLLPAWTKDFKFSRHTYNARSETASEKPSYRNAWKKRHLCLAPMQAFYEPNYESGKAQRWQIARQDKAIFFAASLWEWRSSTNQAGLYSHTLLTVNADANALMKRFHKPEDEKRSIVTFNLDDGLDWLVQKTPDLLQTLSPINPEQYEGHFSPAAKRTKLLNETSES